ncbi:MAG: FAD/NAD(P)-binding protein [Minicystis sp.]
MTFVPRPGMPPPGATSARSFEPEPARIVDVRVETEDTFTLTLDTPGRPRGFVFSPGQFNMLYAFGVGESAISVSGDPAQPSRLVHTIREVGTVTRALRRLGPDGVVGVRGPFGSPWPLDVVRGADLLLIAGGLGLAPLRPALQHALHHRGDYGRVALLYGARSPDGLIFREEIAAWRRRPDLEVLVTVDHADPSWPDHVGVVPALLRLASFAPERAVAFVCGPEVMMRFTARELARRGVTDDRIFLSMERNMKCGVGLCGHCQYGPAFICKDGPVLRYDRIRSLLPLREI